VTRNGTASSPVTLATRSQSLPATAIDLQKITTPLLLHMLRTEMRFPLIFLLRCKLTLGRFKKGIDPRFPAEFVKIIALPLWVYINLKAAIGQDKAFEIMRVTILTGGLAQWNFQYQTTSVERTFANLCDLEIQVNKAGFTRWNTLNVVERTDKRFEIKITRCLYHEVFTAMGVPELTPIICQIDNAAFNSYLPDQVTFNRGGPGHRIADGRSACNFIWEVADDRG